MGHTGGDGEGESSDPAELQAILASAGKGLADLPAGMGTAGELWAVILGWPAEAYACGGADMAEALKESRLSKQILQRFLNLQSSILAPLLGIGYAPHDPLYSVPGSCMCALC